MPATLMVVRSTAALDVDQGPTAVMPISVVIGRSLRDVFAVAADCTKLSRWFSNVVEVLCDSITRPGSLYRITVDTYGQRLMGTLEVTAFQHDRHIGLRSRIGPWRVDGRFLFETLGGGTRVTFVPSTHMSAGFGTARSASDAAVSLVRLRQLLEEPQPN